MKITLWDNGRMEEAKSLLLRATRHHADLLNTELSSEVIEGSTPVVWFGDPLPNNWVTIATNPSTREFLNRENQLLLGEDARFYVRDANVSIEDYAKNDQQLESTINLYRLYFHRETAYSSWFGKTNGGKLEGFLNGMGGSLYNTDNYRRVVHTDFYPISTKSQMGKIKQKEKLLNGKFAREFLGDTLDFLKPSLIIVLGKEHCPRFEHLREKFSFGSVKSIRDFPDAKYQLGLHKKFRIPVVGLHFKPSEQFIGLGGGTDLNGLSHGNYATISAVRTMGDVIKEDLINHFSDYSI